MKEVETVKNTRAEASSALDDKLRLRLEFRARFAKKRRDREVIVSEDDISGISVRFTSIFSFFEACMQRSNSRAFREIFLRCSSNGNGMKMDR